MTDLAEMLIKEKVESNEIKLLKVASADNTSDLGTKRLALPLFNKLTSRIIDHLELIYKSFMFIYRNPCFKLQYCKIITVTCIHLRITVHAHVCFQFSYYVLP